MMTSGYAFHVHGDFWHKLGSDSEKIRRYNRLMINCLVIWENEFVDQDKIVQKVKKFLL